MSLLVDLYRGRAVDTEGRSLKDVLSWPDDELEVVHDFVQWLFPLPEPSRFNPDAPLLTTSLPSMPTPSCVPTFYSHTTVS
jgi:hypothetical protein